MSKVSQLEITTTLMGLFGMSDGSYEEAYRAIRQWVRDSNTVLLEGGGIDIKLSEDAKGEFDLRTI